MNGLLQWSIPTLMAILFLLLWLRGTKKDRAFARMLASKTWILEKASLYEFSRLVICLQLKSETGESFQLMVTDLHPQLEDFVHLAADHLGTNHRCDHGLDGPIHFRFLSKPREGWSAMIVSSVTTYLELVKKKEGES